jgi:large subunit ribosomal protein L21
VYAIVDIGGSQLKISPDARIRIPRVRGAVGEHIKLENVLVLSDGSNIEIGKPYLAGKSLEAEILRHGKERKIVVFKKKRRKKYRRKRGHRQQFTEVLIKSFP